MSLRIALLCLGITVSSHSLANPRADVDSQAGYSPAGTVRLFIVFNYRRLALNIVDRNGVYLDALEQMIVPECQLGAAASPLSDLLVQHSDQVEFAVAVAQRCAYSPVPPAAHTGVRPPEVPRAGTLGI